MMLETVRAVFPTPLSKEVWGRELEEMSQLEYKHQQQKG